MSGPSRRGLVGLGVALGAAGVATAAGIASGRVRRAHRALPERLDGYSVTATEELVVVADDGVPLHVEIDEPDPPTPSNGSRSRGGSRARLERPTIVFTHGYCLTSECWVFQRRALCEAGFRVVVWDQRGHGRSEKGDKGSYRIDQLGQDLFRVIEAAAPEGELALVGHSMGGMTILAMAERHPTLITERVTAFACVATSAGGLPFADGAFTATAVKLLIERLGPGVMGALAKRPELVRSFIRANKELEAFLVERYSFASPVPRGVGRLAAKMILGTDLQVMADFAPTFDAYDKTAALAHFSGVETLVFNGTEDILTPPKHSEAIVEHIPGAEHVIIRDAGHLIMLEHPDLLNEQLRALFERAARAQDEDIAVTRKPRVRSVVTPLASKRPSEQDRRHRARRTHAT